MVYEKTNRFRGLVSLHALGKYSSVPIPHIDAPARTLPNDNESGRVIGLSPKK